MEEILKNAYAQMGAVGLLLAFAGTVIYWLRSDNLDKDKKNAEKDDNIKQEIMKRESLLREVLESHQQTLAAMRALSESLSVVMNRIEDIVERIETKLDATRNKK